LRTTSEQFPFMTPSWSSQNQPQPFPSPKLPPF
jgi:hypothetical protein